MLALHPGWIRTEMGGADAPLAVSASAAGLIGLITTATARDNGSYCSYDGQKIDW